MLRTLWTVGLILVVLKLFNLIQITWWGALSPFWGPVVLLCLFIMSAVFAGIGSALIKAYRRQRELRKSYKELFNEK